MRIASFAMFAGLASACLPAGAARANDVFAAPPASSLGTQTGTMDAASQLRLVLALPMQDPAGARAFANRVSKPGSSEYGHYLTPQQFGARFGASQDAYAKVVAWAIGNGLTPERATAGRLTLGVSGSVATIERLFATRIGSFRTARGEAAFAPLTQPTMPAALGASVSGVVGLAGVHRFVPLLQRADVSGAAPQSAGGTGVGGALSPFDFKTAYDVPALQTQHPQTEQAAVFEQGGFTPADVQTFERKYKLPAVPIVVSGVNGYDGSVNDPTVELEAVLDLETLIGINPKLKQITAYEDGTDTFAVALLASLTAMAEDDTAQTISISYGTPEDNQGAAALQAEDNVLVQLTTQGQAVFASSGDSGAFNGLARNAYVVNDPASQVYVTGVGGTALSTSAGSFYELEVAWGLLAEQIGASGGGVSKYWSIPAYQISEYNPGVYRSVALPNGGSGTYRNVPDVAADASPITGASIYSNVNGGWLQVGGTSLAAPIWAGTYSILSAAHKAAGQPPLGFFNPLAYAVGLYTMGGIHDILSGSNGGFSAGVYYDNVTGWGSMDANFYLLKTFAQAFASGTAPGPASGITVTPASTSAEVTWKAAPGATGYLVSVVIPLVGNYFVAQGATQGRSFKVSGLSPATKYQAFVDAVNGSGITFQYGVDFRTAH